MTTTSLSRLRVGWCLVTTTANCLVALTFLGLVLASVALLLGKLWGFLFTVETLELFIFGLVFIVIASPFAVYAYRPQKATPENAPELLAAMQTCPALLKPRPVVVDLPGPNAFAVGWWPFAFLAVSQDLLDAIRSDRSPLDQESLNAIVAHEMGHHILGHSAFMPPFALAAWASDRALQLLRGEFPHPRQIPIFLLALVLAPLIKLIQATFSQEFEFAADAVSALYRGSSKPMIDALSALAPSLDQAAASPLESILASHPGVDERIARLASYQSLPSSEV